MTDLPPHDLAAEQAALGAALQSPAAAEVCRQALMASDFFRPAHMIIFAEITATLRDGGTPDAIVINDRLVDGKASRQTGGAPYLHTLLQACPLPANARYYARIVREKAVHRRLLQASARITQLAEDESEDAHALIERAISELEGARAASLDTDVTVQSVTEFLGEEDQDVYDWVIPGLLERGDRLILTGMEGAGKSELLRMFAVCAAAGLHPFDFSEIRPCRVLLIDCENSKPQVRRKLRPLVAQARLQGHPVTETNLWIECRPGGMDLALEKDLSWLLRQVAATSPDVAMLGPLYRLVPRALNDDSDAAPVLAALNTIRAKGCTLILEAHAGHQVGAGGLRDMRPRGSAALLGWPEFGLGLRWSDQAGPGTRLVSVVHWRGDRDERHWPRYLIAGGTWPWRPWTPPPKERADDWTTA